jgi:hypothetical protein
MDVNKNLNSIFYYPQHSLENPFPPYKKFFNCSNLILPKPFNSNFIILGCKYRGRNSVIKKAELVGLWGIHDIINTFTGIENFGRNKSPQ